jgi:hypothetical protein
VENKSTEFAKRLAGEDKTALLARLQLLELEQRWLSVKIQYMEDLTFDVFEFDYQGTDERLSEIAYEAAVIYTRLIPLEKIATDGQFSDRLEEYQATIKTYERRLKNGS